MNVYGKVLFSELLRILLLPLRLFPIRKNRVVFTGLTGGGTNEYSGNPAYLCDYLLQKCPGKYEIVWAVSDPQKYRALEEKGIRLIRHFSLRSFYWLLTAQAVVSNGSYAPWFPFRRRQYFINTWHGGGAYKKIENGRPDANRATRRRAKICAENISLFVSTCKKATKYLIRGTFCYRGEVLEAGMPRNDFLIRGELTDAVEAVRLAYGLDAGTKIVLYAPTYRKGETEVCLNADHLLETLEQGGEHWVFLYRAHRYQDASGRLFVKGKRVLAATDYPDMQQLLAAAAILITDYSSNIWDYSFLYRPCFLYTPDLKEYTAKTGFYVDIREWPFPMAKTQEELEEQILQSDLKEIRKRIAAHHRMMGNCETGRSCELLEKKLAAACGLSKGA